MERRNDQTDKYFEISPIKTQPSQRINLIYCIDFHTGLQSRIEVVRLTKNYKGVLIKSYHQEESKSKTQQTDIKNIALACFFARTRGKWVSIISYRILIFTIRLRTFFQRLLSSSLEASIETLKGSIGGMLKRTTLNQHRRVTLPSLSPLLVWNCTCEKKSSESWVAMRCSN